MRAPFLSPKSKTPVMPGLWGLGSGRKGVEFMFPLHYHKTRTGLEACVPEYDDESRSPKA